MRMGNGGMTWGYSDGGDKLGRKAMRGFEGFSYFFWTVSMNCSSCCAPDLGPR